MNFMKKRNEVESRLPKKATNTSRIGTGASDFEKTEMMLKQLS